MHGVPEGAATERRPVLRGVVQVDIDDMGCQLVHHVEPAVIATAKELDEGAVDGIVLVVVVGDDGWRPSVIGCLVIRVNVSEVSPAVLVDDLALALEGVIALYRRLDESQVVGIRVGALRREVRDGAGLAIPLRRRVGNEGRSAPTPGGSHRQPGEEVTDRPRASSAHRPGAHGGRRTGAGTGG